MIRLGPTRKKYDFLSKMAAASKSLTVTWLESSFFERVNSVANKVVTKGSTLIAPDETGVLATIRLSRKFMNLVRESRTHFSLSLLHNFAEDKE